MSSRLIYNDDDRLLAWAAAKIGIDRFHADARTIGLERDGEVVAVVVYDCFSSVQCDMHIASDGTKQWMTKDILVASFAYPFIQCGFESMTGIVPADNQRAIDFNRHLGWTEVGVRHRAGPGGKDILIMEMLRKDCRFIPGEYRK